ncbi:MAG: VacJ family lipoprotein [Rhodocyclaceae bacterium]
MRALVTPFLAAIVLATTACANNAIKHPAANPENELQAAPAAVVIADSDTQPMPTLAMPGSREKASVPQVASESADVAEASDASQVGFDADASYDLALADDPWEGFNRRMHSFNNTIDRFVLRPAALGYKRVTPDSVQAGVSRFFANLSMPVTAVNQALQGRAGDAASSLGRFAVNTTIGIAGIFDPAAHFGMPRRDGEDFGQTLAIWGWRDSRYLVLPLLGPRTVRDAVGLVGDLPLSPVSHIDDSTVAIGFQALELVDMRMRLLPTDQLRRDALDDYLFVRDAWFQRRKHLIEQEQR